MSRLIWNHNALAGFWLGVVWTLTQITALSRKDPVLLGPALWELAGNILVWGGIGLALFLATRRLGAVAPRVHGTLLLGLFVVAQIDLLFIYYLARGVFITSPMGLGLLLGLTAILALIPIVLAWRARRRCADEPQIALPLEIGLVASVALVIMFTQQETRQWWRLDDAGRFLLAAGLGTGLQALLFTLYSRRRVPRPVLSVGALAALLGVLVTVQLTARDWERAPRVADADADADAPPVILISLDTTRPDHFSHFGYHRPTTLSLDAHLETFRVYPSAYGTSSWTLPSHASVFTGVLPIEHGAHFDLNQDHGKQPPMPLSPSLTTLAEQFRDRGYITQAIAANPLSVSRKFDADRGFQGVDASVRVRSLPFRLSFVQTAGDLVRLPVLMRAGERYRSAGTITDRCLDWVDDREGQPFFLFVNYADPHIPYVPSRPFSRQGDSPFLRLPVDAQHPRNRERVIDLYDGELAYMAHHVARLLDGLAERGILDRALIIMFSDHGEYLGKPGGKFGIYWRHGQTVEEDVLRVLFAARYPHGAGAGFDSTLVNLTDVHKLTRAFLQGTQAELDRKGPWIAGEKFLSHDELDERGWPGARRMVAVRQDNLKLVDYGTAAKLFDLRRDPLERIDLADAFPETTRVLRAFLADWHGSITIPAPDQDEAKAAERLKQLRSLGYMN